MSLSRFSSLTAQTGNNQYGSMTTILIHPLHDLWRYLENLNFEEMMKRNAFPEEPLDSKDRQLIQVVYAQGATGMGFNRLVASARSFASMNAGCGVGWSAHGGSPPCAWRSSLRPTFATKAWERTFSRRWTKAVSSSIM